MVRRCFFNDDKAQAFIEPSGWVCVIISDGKFASIITSSAAYTLLCPEQLDSCLKTTSLDPPFLLL